MPGGNPLFVKGNNLSPYGRGKGTPNKATREIKEYAQKFLSSPEYIESSERRMLAGEAPHLETLLAHYAWGKPVERVALTNPDGTKEFGIELLQLRQKISKMLSDDAIEAELVDGSTANSAANGS